MKFGAAIAHCSAGAELNSLEAWQNLAAMHATGQGMPKNEETARAILSMVQRIQKEAGAGTGQQQGSAPSAKQ